MLRTCLYYFFGKNEKIIKIKIKKANLDAVSKVEPAGGGLSLVKVPIIIVSSVALAQ